MVPAVTHLLNGSFDEIVISMKMPLMSIFKTLPFALPEHLPFPVGADTHLKKQDLASFFKVLASNICCLGTELYGQRHPGKKKRQWKALLGPES